MSELNDLYQEVILDHNRRPHNFRVIDPASAKQEGYNPLVRGLHKVREVFA
jgi:nitrogen fixation NifU-like protein